MLQILPVAHLRLRSSRGVLFAEAFGAKRFVRFFEVSCEFGLHFVVLGGIESEIGEAAADKFLPIVLFPIGFLPIRHWRLRRGGEARQRVRTTRRARG